MNGCWIPNTPIAVDFWRTLKCPAKIFFLSHMHADHTSGLSSSWKDNIYCSEISAKLLKAKFDIRDELIRPLTTGVSHIVELDVLNSITMTVTLIDAHHCPGAVMFLFEGYFGTILYTGDFRFCEEMLPDLDVLNGKSIDTLYFDNTYNSPEFLFPPRDDAKQVIMQIIDDHKDDAVIVIGMFTLGKEDLLVDIAKHFRTWIVVSPDKMKQVKLLDLPDVFTTDVDASWIRVERKMKITNNNIAKWNKEQATVAILPTALYSNSQVYRSSSNIHAVPYSDHSSYPELLRFVAHIKPRRLIPIVRKGGDSYVKNSITELNKFDTLLDKTPQSTLIIPRVFQMNSFNSFNKVMMMQKTFQSRLKRKLHSVGVKFLDSPDEDKTPKQRKLSENLNEESMDVRMKTDECIDCEKSMKENMQAGPINVVDNCNNVVVSTGSLMKTPQAMDSSEKKKPMKHLIEIFAGQSPQQVNGTIVAEKTDTSQLTLFNFFQKRDSSPTVEDSCSILTPIPQVKTVSEAEPCSPKNSPSDSFGDPITQPFQSDIKSLSGVEDSCVVLKTGPSCSSTNSPASEDTSVVLKTGSSCSSTNSPASEDTSVVLKTGSSCSSTNSHASEDSSVVLKTGSSCSSTNPPASEDTSVVLKTASSCSSTNSPASEDSSVVLKTESSCSSSTNSSPSTKDSSGALPAKTRKELREEHRLYEECIREVLDCLEVSADGQAYFI